MKTSFITVFKGRALELARQPQGWPGRPRAGQAGPGLAKQLQPCRQEGCRPAALGMIRQIQAPASCRPGLPWEILQVQAGEEGKEGEAGEEDMEGEAGEEGEAALQVHGSLPGQLACIPWMTLVVAGGGTFAQAGLG